MPAQPNGFAPSDGLFVEQVASMLLLNDERVFSTDQSVFGEGTHVNEILHTRLDHISHRIRLRSIAKEAKLLGSNRKADIIPHPEFFVIPDQNFPDGIYRDH